MKKSIVILFFFVNVNIILAQIKTHSDSNNVFKVIRMKTSNSLVVNVNNRPIYNILRAKMLDFDSTAPLIIPNSYPRDSNSLLLNYGKQNNATHPTDYIVRGVLNYIPKISFRL